MYCVLRCWTIWRSLRCNSFMCSSKLMNLDGKNLAYFIQKQNLRRLVLMSNNKKKKKKPKMPNPKIFRKSAYLLVSEAKG